LLHYALFFKIIVLYDIIDDLIAINTNEFVLIVILSVEIDLIEIR